MPLRTRGNYFCLCSCCIVVEGSERSALCDIQRGSFILLNPDQTYLLKLSAQSTLHKMALIYDAEAFDNIMSFFEDLIDQWFVKN